MPYNAVRRAFSGADNIAKTIAVPHDHRPSRLPSFPNLERTAVLSMTTTSTMAVAAASALSDGKAEARVLRSVTYPVWATQLAALSTESLGLYWTSSGLTSFTLEAQGDIWMAPEKDLFQAPGRTGTSTRIDVGQYPLGVDEAGMEGYVFLPPGIAFACNLGLTTSTTSSVTFVFDCITTGGEHTQKTLTGVGSISGPRMTASSSNFGDGLWIRLERLVCSTYINDVVVNAIRLGLSTDGDLWAPSPSGSNAHLMLPVSKPPELSITQLPYQAARNTAAAALFTNVTAVLNKEGTIGAIRVPTATSNGNVWASDAYDVMSPDVQACERYWGPLEKGLYCYTLPDAASEVFRDHALESTGLSGRFHIFGSDYINVIRFTDYDSASGSVLAVTSDRHVEFRTSSILFPIGFSMVSLENYHLAQMALAKQGVFFENPVHLAAIASMVGNALRALAPIVMPYARSAMGAVGSAVLSRASSAINTKMSQMGLSEPKPAQPKKKTRSRPPARKVTVRRRGKK